MSFVSHSTHIKSTFSPVYTKPVGPFFFVANRAGFLKTCRGTIESGAVLDTKLMAS